MKKYKCHKEVEAAKITKIIKNPNDSVDLFFGEGIDSTNKDKDWIDKHNPDEGGYFVRYADGYESYSPAKAFEEGYTEIILSADGLTEGDLKVGVPVTYYGIIKKDGTKLDPTETHITVETWLIGRELVCKVKGIVGAVSVSHIELREEKSSN